MSNTVKRVLATVLILLGTFLLIMMIDDFYMKTAITAIFVTIATFILRRRKKIEEKKRLHARLEKELDEEERLEKQEAQEAQEAQEETFSEENTEETTSDNIEEKIDEKSPKVEK
ncbi:MAG: hypothetical protein ACLFPS_03380 [Clostridia bacterium]